MVARGKPAVSRMVGSWDEVFRWLEIMRGGRTESDLVRVTVEAEGPHPQELPLDVGPGLAGDPRR